MCERMMEQALASFNLMRCGSSVSEWLSELGPPARCARLELHSSPPGGRGESFGGAPLRFYSDSVGGVSVSGSVVPYQGLLSMVR